MAGFDDGAAQARNDWALAHDRRVHATRVSRRLQPAALLLGGYASSRLRVRLGGRPERRPPAALVLGDPPADGVARVAPLLVVEYAPAEATWWLVAGSTEVWVLEAEALVAHRATTPVRRLVIGDEVRVAGSDEVALSVRSLLPKARLLEHSGT